MAACSSILAWEVPWTEESGRLQTMEPHKEPNTTERLNNKSGNIFKLYEQVFTKIFV